MEGNCRMRPIDLGQQDAAAGRGAFHFRASSPVGMKKTPTDGSFTLL
jgi:hypothetical protein